MSTLLFVHGISVRDVEYRTVLPWLRAHLKRIRPDMDFAFCYWGGSWGAVLGAGGISIPQRRGNRKCDDFLAESEKSGQRGDRLWELLLEDPTLELHLLSQTVPNPKPFPVDGVSPREVLVDRARSLAADPRIDALLRDEDLAEEFAASVAVVLDTEAASRAVRAAGELGDSLRLALARAFIAVTLVRAAEDEGCLPLPADDVDRLVNEVFGALGGVDKAGALVRSVVACAGRYLGHKRADLTRRTVPWIGDIARYLTRGGEDIRADIAASVTEAAATSPPVYLLGHSLGGVACVDLLAQQSMPDVKLLVTVGTPVSYLYELNALPSRAFGTGLGPFPRWVNIYDPNDLVAFAAEQRELFLGKVADRVVHNGVPFPRSHLAYFRSRAFYDVLAEVLP